MRHNKINKESKILFKYFGFFIDFIEIIFPSIILVVILVSFSTEVLARYIFNISFMWTQEISTYSYLWMVFLGACYCERTKSNIVFSIVYDEVSPFLKMIFDAVSHIMISIVLIILIPSAINFYQFFYTRTTVTLKIPLAIVYFGFAIFMAITIPRELYRLYLTIHDIIEYGKGGRRNS
jgi:TRAP-type C4-dicarboxylate transport system permease small subunit